MGFSGIHIDLQMRKASVCLFFHAREQKAKASLKSSFSELIIITGVIRIKVSRSPCYSPLVCIFGKEEICSCLLCWIISQKVLFFSLSPSRWYYGLLTQASQQGLDLFLFPWFQHPWSEVLTKSIWPPAIF